MIFAALVLLQAQAKPSYVIGGDTITVEVPTWKSPEALPFVDHGGSRYSFRDGRLTSKSRAGGGWDEVSTPVPTSETAVKVPVLFQLVNRIDVRTDVGHLLQRQGDIYTDDWRAMKREAALFCFLVNQYSGGKVAIEPTWRVDESLMFMDGEPWGTRASAYLSPIVNATAEKPSEGLGPFGSMFVLHPGFERAMAVSTLDGRPVVSVPVYAFFDRARPGQLARSMFNGWAMGSAAKSIVGDWLQLGPLPLANLEDWSESGVLWKLPKVTPEQMSGLLGRPIPDVEKEFAVSGRGAIVVGEALITTVPFAGIFESKFKAIGAFLAGSGPWIVFEKGSATPSMSDAELLGVKAEEAGVGEPVDLRFGPGEAERLPVSGSFSAKTVADPERGSVGEIREMSFRRSGWVRLAGAFDAAKSPYLEFMLKPRGSTWPVNLVVETSGGLGVFQMFGRTAGLTGVMPAYSEATSFLVATRPEPGWHKVVLDLRLIGAKGPVKGIYLAAPAFAHQSVMPRNTDAPALLLDDLSVRAEATGPVNAMAAIQMVEGPSATADDPFARARFAHTTDDQAALTKLLEDPYDLVRWNAADRFRTIKNAQAIPKLTEIARHYNPRLSQSGTLALGYQGTETAIAAIRYNYQTALGDFSKMFGAQVMPAINERKILADLAIGLNAHHPAARCEVVRALARQPFKEAALVMMTFLNDTEPTVRIAVLEALPMKDDIVLARVIGEARNDPSDDVRIAAFKRLKEWGAPEAGEAAKDPSPRVRGS